MRTFLMQNGLWALARALTAMLLTLIGLVAGAGCVLFPQALPWAILGMAGLLLLWVMPDLQSVPVRIATRMLPIFVFSFLCVPAYYAIITPGLPWISVRRVVFGIFTTAVVITLSGSAATRANLSARLRRTPVLSSFLIAYALITLLANATTSNLATSIPTTINIVLYELIPFIAASFLIKTPRSVFVIFLTCAFGVILDFVLGGIESRLQRPFLIYALPSAMQSELLSQSTGFVSLISIGVRNGVARAQSIYNTSLSWGEMAAMMAPVALFFTLPGRRLSWMLFGGIAYVACLGSVYLSGSRGGYVGFIAGSLLFFALLVARLIKARPQSLIGPTALCICAIVGTATLSSVFFVKRVHDSVLGNYATQASNDGRSEQWALAEPKILARPVLGYGPGTAPGVVGWTNLAGAPSLDSYAITMLVNLGIPGCIAFFGLLISAILKCVTLYLRGTSQVDDYHLSLACLIVSYTLYRLTLSQTENNTLLFTLLGVVVSLSSIGATTQRSNSSAGRSTAAQSPRRSRGPEMQIP